MQVLTPPGPVRGRVAFLVPRWTTDPIPFGTQGLPFRSLSVASALFNAGHEVVWFDQEHDLDRADRLADLRRELDTTRIVFAWMSDLAPMIQSLNLLRLAGEIRASHPHVPIATGGGFISLFRPEGLFVNWPVDYFIRGYGEEAATRLVDAIEGRATFESVPGLVFTNGAHRSNPMAPRAPLRSEDTSLYHRLDLKPYVQRGGIFDNDEPALIVGTGRGCAKGCGFCYWRNHAPSMLDAETVASLVAALRDRYGVRQFHFGELDFFANRLRPVEIARRLESRAPDVRWFALCSPVDGLALSDADWDRLAAGGCVKLEFGAETGSPRMLERIQKRHRPEDVVTLCRKLLARGMQPMVNFVFALVGETDQDRSLSFDLVRRLHDLAPGRIHFTFRFFQPAWDTPMGDEAIGATPDFPTTIADMVAYRPGFGHPEHRALRWIDADVEKRLKEAIYYHLPLATSRRAASTGTRRLAYYAFRAIARARLRTQVFECAIERRLFRALIGGGIDSTYVT